MMRAALPESLPPFLSSEAQRGGFPIMAASIFKQQCPTCDAMVPIKDRGLVGKKIDCPKCKARFVVEDPDAGDEDDKDKKKKKDKGDDKAAKGKGDDKPSK